MVNFSGGPINNPTLGLPPIRTGGIKPSKEMPPPVRDNVGQTAPGPPQQDPRAISGPTGGPGPIPVPGGGPRLPPIRGGGINPETGMEDPRIRNAGGDPLGGPRFDGGPIRRPPNFGGGPTSAPPPPPPMPPMGFATGGGRMPTQGVPTQGGRGGGRARRRNTGMGAPPMSGIPSTPPMSPQASPPSPLGRFNWQRNNLRTPGGGGYGY